MATKTVVPQRIAVTPAPVAAPDRDPPLNFPAIEVGNRDGKCPECGHESVDEESAVDRWVRQTFRKLTRRRPKPARCTFQPWDRDWETASGPQCKCRCSFHGS
jgi:hypothetical protein